MFQTYQKAPGSISEAGEAGEAWDADCGAWDLRSPELSPRGRAAGGGKCASVGHGTWSVYASMRTRCACSKCVRMHAAEQSRLRVPCPTLVPSQQAVPLDSGTTAFSGSRHERHSITQI